MTEFANKLGDTVLWASIGAAVRGAILKLIQSVQMSHPNREDKPIPICAETRIKVELVYALGHTRSTLNVLRAFDY